VKFNDLYLWYVGEPQTPRYVGELHLVDAGKGVSLKYGQEWLKHGFMLSDDLPLVDIEFFPPIKNTAVGAVDDARPDRWGELVIQYVDKPERLSIMEFLFYAGDDRFGALGVSTSASQYIPRPGSPLPRLDDAQLLSEAVRKVNAREKVNELERKVLSTGGSFGGAKPKALIEINGEQWIIKFFNNEPIDVPLVEHATMTLANKAGIQVAETKVIRLIGEHVLLVRRFDRQGLKRIHSVSAGTALRAITPAGQEPNFGYPALAQLLRSAGDQENKRNSEDMKELFRRMVFNILIDNTDDHEKNHALLVESPNKHGKYKLSPAYDVLTTNSGQGYQEFICGINQRDSTLENAMSQFNLFGMTSDEAVSQVVRVIDVVDGWKKHFVSCGVCESDLNSLSDRIDGEELLKERRSFTPSDYTSRSVKKKTSPFSR